MAKATHERSDLTQRYYQRRVRSILQDHHRETGKTWQEDPMGFIQWLHERKETRWKRSTWRMSRVAIREYLEHHGAPQEVLDLLDKEKNPPGKAKGSFEARRVRYFHEQDLESILHWLETEGRGSYDGILSAFLQANIRVGLRPSEWDDAHWEDFKGTRYLSVRNRKTSNGRGNGEERLLEIDPAYHEDIQRLLDERDRLYHLGFHWPEIQKGMQHRLNHIRKFLTKPSYTLYSTRHRFVSVAKQSGFSKAHIANMLGHGSLRTASIHYGRKSFGSGRSPSETEMDAKAIAVIRGIGIVRQADPGPEAASTTQDHADSELR